MVQVIDALRKGKASSRRIEVVVPDFAKVVSPDLLPTVKLQASDASRRGVQYEVANGEKIPNLGEKLIQGYTHCEGFARSVTVQVCDVTKPLMSVHKMVKASHKVVVDEDGAYIEHKATQERIWLQESGGMYMLKLWVRASGTGTDAGF